MNLYDRWIVSPWQEMPDGLRRLFQGACLGIGVALSFSLGARLDSGERIFVFGAVALFLAAGIAILWRLRHRTFGPDPSS